MEQKKLKIMLVRPPVPKHTIGLKHIMICEPLDLEYIAAAIDGHEIQIFDHLVERGFKKRFLDFNPDLVASSCYKSGTNEVIKLFRQIKTWKPACITVAGGVHATLIPEDFNDVAVDVIGIGDGTTLFSDLVRAIATQTPLEQIPGLAIPLAEGSLHKTPGKSYMPNNPDELPFPRRDLVAHLQHKYYYLMHTPVATMKTTWGCWYKCNFCFTWKITDGVPYSRSPESIVAELETIEANDVYIVDDIFLIKRSRLDRIAQLLREKNIRKKYLVYARADFIAANEDVIKEWAELGLSAVFIGLEATTNEELNGMNKQTEALDNEKAIAVLRKYKVDTYGSLIPLATFEKKDWQRMWDFIERTGLYYVNISPETPLPGTDTWPAYKDKLTVPADAHGLFDLSHMLLPTKMPIRAYYYELLKIYARTILNFNRAAKNAQRTLPSVFSVGYMKLIWGSLKIGRQFIMAYKHHSKADIAWARNRGPVVPGLTYASKFAHPSFSFMKEKISQAS